MKCLLVGSGDFAIHVMETAAAVRGVEIERAESFAKRKLEVFHQYGLVLVLVGNSEERDALYAARAAYDGKPGPCIAALVKPGMKGRLGEVLEMPVTGDFEIAADEVLPLYRYADEASVITHLVRRRLAEYERVTAECWPMPTGGAAA